MVEPAVERRWYSQPAWVGARKLAAYTMIAMVSAASDPHGPFRGRERHDIHALCSHPPHPPPSLAAKAERYPFVYLWFGAQRSANTVALFSRARELGVGHLTEQEMAEKGLNQVKKAVLDRFPRRVDSVMATVDADVVSSAFAPGLRAPQPLGLDPEPCGEAAEPPAGPGWSRETRKDRSGAPVRERRQDRQNRRPPGRRPGGPPDARGGKDPEGVRVRREVFPMTFS